MRIIILMDNNYSDIILKAMIHALSIYMKTKMVMVTMMVTMMNTIIIIIVSATKCNVTFKFSSC